jgi:hypothetical protein
VHDEENLGDVRVSRAAMLLVRELDDRVAVIVEEAIEAGDLAFGLGTHAVRELDVLALDDRPHGLLPPRFGQCSRAM